MNTKPHYLNRLLTTCLSAFLLCFSCQNAHAQFIGGVGAAPESSVGSEGVGAGALGSDLGATIEAPAVVAAPVGSGVGAGSAAGSAAVGGLSTAAAIALGVVAVAAIAVAASSGSGSGSGTTGTK